MGLHPLEFSECYLDSPSFREKIKAHEAELDRTNRFIKELYKDGKNLINATKQLGMAQRKFAQCLGEFQFEYIGDAKTDDEKCIGKCGFDANKPLMRNITETLMKPLEKFRKDHLGTAERKKYEKETEKYYSSLEKLLNMSAKKKEPQLQEADVQVETMRLHFQEESLDYVCKLQEIQERKKFECVEPMLAFFQTVFTFYHQGFELAKDFDHYKRALQINIQNTRSRFEGARSEVFELMKRIRETPQEYRQTSPISCEGYLYVQEKRPPPFGSSWVKRYSTFVKEQKILHMVTFDHRSGGKIGETESVTLKSCLRKTTDVLDRRFCLELDITDRPGTVLTVQALSEDDHKFWMQAMGGKEPVSQLPAQCHQPLTFVIFLSVAAHSKQNLMTVANLGVVFGPTLMRPQEDTVAAIMDLKFQNIVVEILIEHNEKVTVKTEICQTCSAVSTVPSQSNTLETEHSENWKCLILIVLYIFYVTSRKAKAVYPCEAEHDSELSFQVGAIFNAVTQSREPGWLEGELEGKRGLIPENYVEML
uniref:Rho GTPase activating protein 10 n=1 Tax=Sander lucioperca TaxID=283035 RepID=A0A8D0CXH3_SANLU